MGRRMFGNELTLVIDPPRAIEELSNFDVSLGIGGLVGTGRQIRNQICDSNAVIITHNRAIAEADHSVQIELCRSLASSWQSLHPIPAVLIARRYNRCNYHLGNTPYFLNFIATQNLSLKFL